MYLYLIPLLNIYYRYIFNSVLFKMRLGGTTNLFTGAWLCFRALAKVVDVI